MMTVCPPEAAAMGKSLGIWFAYSLGPMQNAIWWGRNRAMTLRAMAAGLLHVVLTAGMYR